MFLGFILAGPYLMWKLISSLNINANAKGAKAWATGQGDHFLAVAQYDFDGMADRELKLRSGQKIRLAPASSQPANVKGWVLASDGVKIGLVPTNYIKILGKRTGGSGDSEISMPQPSAHVPSPSPMTHHFGSHSMHPTLAPVKEEEAAVSNPNIVITPPELGGASGSSESSSDKLA
jgi:peroxin-13